VEYYDQGKTVVLIGKPAPVPRCPPHISYTYWPRLELGFYGEMAAANHLSHCLII